MTKRCRCGCPTKLDNRGTIDKCGPVSIAMDEKLFEADELADRLTMEKWVRS